MSIVYCDLVGCIESKPRQVYQYVFKITEHATRWEEVFLLRSKPDLRVVIRRFNLSEVISHNKRIVRLRPDRGSEFTCKEFEMSAPNSASDWRLPLWRHHSGSEPLSAMDVR